MNPKTLKPYAIAQIEHPTYGGWWRCICEIMSFPIPPTNEFPKGSIMVRRVPGQPTTLDEVSLEVLRPVDSRAKTLTIHYARVINPGRHFPSDMLRYDSCEPVTFTVDDDGVAHLNKDAAELGLIVADVHPGHKPAQWTQERWRSFMARVEPIKSETFAVASYAR